MSFDKIKTLDEILAEMGNPISANGISNGNKNDKSYKNNTDNANNTDKNPPSKNFKAQKPSFQTPKTPLIKDKKANYKKTPPLSTKQENKQIPKDNNSIANIDLSNNQALQEILANTPYQPLEIESKEVRYLRWLAFYYLSRRELSAYELKQKLLAKGCDIDKVNELLIEFATKGYQSDERCAYMMIRESVRKNRGRTHIKNALRQARLNLPYDFDELIAQAGVSVLDDENGDEQVNWLKLATQARTKKYGDSIPTTPKEKARQLRFLQYRGFEMGVCLQALKMTMGDFDEYD